MAIAYNLSNDGISEPKIPIQHGDDLYPEDRFHALRIMQTQRFWYRWQHRVLRDALGCHRAASVGHISAGDLRK